MEVRLADTLSYVQPITITIRYSARSMSRFSVATECYANEGADWTKGSLSAQASQPGKQLQAEGHRWCHCTTYMPANMLQTHGRRHRLRQHWHVTLGALYVSASPDRPDAIHCRVQAVPARQQTAQRAATAMQQAVADIEPDPVIAAQLMSTGFGKKRRTAANAPQSPPTQVSVHTVALVVHVLATSQLDNSTRATSFHRCTSLVNYSEGLSADQQRTVWCHLAI